ncbi:ribonuclease T2-like, partial [Dissophora globulifera]
LMKFNTIAAFIAVAVVSVVSALPLHDSALDPLATCPANVLSCSPASHNVNSCCVPTYGLVVLTQQWYPRLGSPKEFTMHFGPTPVLEAMALGMVVQKEDDDEDSSMYPHVLHDVESRLQNYSGTPSGFMNDMNNYWPTYAVFDNSFWSHEWSEHGTCVSTIAPSCIANYVQDEDVYTYFSTALALRSEHNIYQALAAKGIYPGSSYDASSMQAAIKAKFGVHAGFKCMGNNVLREIRLFFNVRNADQYELTEPQWNESCRGMISYPNKYE